MADEDEAQNLLESLSAAVMPTEVEVRNLAKREVDVRIVPWDRQINTVIGPEMFMRGAFEGTDASKILLMGLEHEMHLGLSQNGTPKLTRRPIGKGISLDERDDGAYMTFRVAKTAAGDEYLALAVDKVVDGVSVEMGHNARVAYEQRNGRRTTLVKWADLRAVAPTYQPAYTEARVLAVRSEAEEAPVAEAEAPVIGAVHDSENAEFAAAMRAEFSKLGTSMEGFAEKFADRISHIEEQQRSQFTVPGEKEDKPLITRGEWVSTVLKLLSGERVPDMQLRALDDLITTDNAGVVPDAISSELVGVIDPSRPFMQSTRRLETPSSGLTLVMPRIVTRPTVAVQSQEKGDVDSTPTSIDTVDFTAATYAGGGDISLQLLKRSSPSFLGLYVELLAEAYALTTEAAAVASIMAAGVNSGGALDPEALALGSAWSSAVTSAFRRGPDTIWMSSAAVAAFIDAKNDGSNAPLYSQLSANFTAGGGVGGTIQGLRAVYVPAMDATANDVLVGPSRGFAWAEDGTFTLQVDVPAKAGRDVAMVGIVWFAPIYPSAFTAYSVSGGGR